jgi:hypothetical protein
MSDTIIGREKHTKKEARYEPKATGKDYCAICVYYEPWPEDRSRGTCRVVEGAINAEGWSKFFKRKK